MMESLQVVREGAKYGMELWKVRAPPPPSRPATADATLSCLSMKRNQQMTAFFRAMIPYTICLLLLVPRIASCCDNQSSRPVGTPILVTTTKRK